MLKPTPFFYLRHGQTDWNSRGITQGQSNIPLNEQGVLQARAAKSALTGLGISRICCSPLDRARQTADIINEALQLPITVINDLAEANWGVREGQKMGQWFTDWKRGVTPENAESYDHFMARALSGVNQALSYPDTVLIVAHGGLYWTVQEHAKLETGSILGNCLPVHHLPPAHHSSPWTTKVIEG